MYLIRLLREVVLLEASVGKRERGNRKLITKETRTIRGSLLGSAGSLIKGRFKINICPVMIS